MLSFRKKDVFPLFVLIIFSAIFILILSGEISLDYMQAFHLSYVYIVFFVLLVKYNKKIPKMSISMMVVYYSFIQAVGIPLSYLFSPEYTITQIERGKYFYGHYMGEYVALSLLAVTLLFIGILTYPPKIEKSTQNLNPLEKPTLKAEQQTPLEKNFFLMGFVLVVLFALFMTYNVLNGRIVFNNYEKYKYWANRSTLRNYLQIGYWLASIFICACGTKKQVIWSALIFLIPSAILFAAGNRNDVFFPLLIGLGFYHMRFQKIPKWIFVALFLVVFLLSPMLIQFRTGGSFEFAKVFENIFESIGESIYELGGQLHAVSNMFMWLDNGEGYAYGLTYLLGFLVSLFAGFVPSLKMFYETSRYHFQPRVESLGFAMSAELYFNFGVLGVVIFYFIFGRYVAKYETVKLSPQKSVVYGFIIFWLLFLVRNIFGYTLVYAKVFVVLYVCIFFVTQVLQKKKNVGDVR